jgi:hypothetical protein
MTTPKPETAEAFTLRIAMTMATLQVVDEDQMAFALAALIAERDELIRAEARERIAAAENSAASTKATLDELHEYVAQMCEHFGDTREEIPCDAWRLRDHVVRAVAAREELVERAELAETSAGEWEDWALEHCDPSRDESIDDEKLRVLINDRIASLEAQLATAREVALRATVLAVESLHVEPSVTPEAFKERVLFTLRSFVAYYPDAAARNDAGYDESAPLTSPPPRVDGWIPVGERLPEPGASVLVYSDRYGTIITRRYSVRGEAHWADGGVTHWAPLLPPPAQKEPL